MPPKKMYPQYWRRYWRHNRNPVKFCLHLEYNASINQMLVHSYYCQELVTGGTGYGFVVADPENDCDADFPLKYSFRIDDWSQQLYNVFAKTSDIPSGQAQTILLSCQGNGYLFLRRMHSLLNPNLMDIPSSVCSTIPTQASSLFLDYVWNVQFHHHMQGFIQDQEVDLGNTHVQDMFISNMDHSDIIIAELYHDRKSTLKSKLAKVEANTFVNTMSLLVNKLYGNDSISSAWSSKPQSRPPSKSSFSRNKINAATNVVCTSTEYGMSSDPDFTSVGLHSSAFDDIDLDTCNDADLGLLLEAINQIGSNLNSAFDTSRPCVICGGTGHTVDGCKVLLDSTGVKTAYIKLRVALNRLHGISGKFGQSNTSALRSHTISSNNIAERSFGSVSVSSSGASSLSTSSIYKLMKIQTKAIAESNRLVSARLSSLKELVGDTDNDGDGDDASGGTGSSSLNETNMANFIRAASKSR
jgi:hypothetical protein